MAESPTAYLERYLRSPSPVVRTSQTQQSDLVRFILATGGGSHYTQIGGGAVPKHGGPSILSRIIDVFSRPNYAVAGATSNILDTGHGAVEGASNILGFLTGRPSPQVAAAGTKGIISGLAGTQKTTFEDTLHEHGGVNNPFVRYGGGLALDILTDPTTYVGFGAIGKAGKVLGLGKKAQEIADAEKAAKAVRGADEFVDEARGRTAALLPQAFKRPVIPKATPYSPLISAEHVVAGVEAKDPHFVVRVMPKPKPTPDEGEKFVGETIAEQISPRLKKNPHQAKINREAPGAINPAQQANIFNKTLNQAIKHLQVSRKIKNPTANRFKNLRGSKAYKMLIASENALEAMGHTHVMWDGSKVKLSDVMAELPGVHPSDVAAEFAKKEPSVKVAEAIERLKARSAIEDAPKVQSSVTGALIKKAKADALPVSFTDKMKFYRAIKQMGKDAATGAGASPVGVRSTDNLLKDILFSPKGTPTELVFNPAYIKIKSFAEARDLLTKRLEKVMEPWSTSQKDTENWLMARMATWWGQKDLRPIHLTGIASAIAAARRREEFFKHLVKTYTPGQLNAGWDSARGLSAPGDILGQQMNAAMEDFMNIVRRSHVTLDEFNKHLGRVKSAHQLKSGEFVDEAGRRFEDDPWNSWKAWSTDDPVDIFGRVALAVENATREKAVIDELATRFGARIPTREANVRVNHHYLEGVYFNREIASQVVRVLHDMDKFYDPQSDLMKLMDKVLSAWKSGVTVYSPSHHVRNIIGDTFLSWIAGVNSPVPYRLAVKAMRANSDKYVDMMADPRYLFRAPVDEGGKKLFTNKSGVKFTARQIYSAGFNRGLFLPARTVEDIYTAGELIPKQLRPFGGHLQHGVRHLAENREHFVRMAHFIDIVQKSKGNNLEKIFNDAANTVRKWHPDGLDLTEFEKRTLRRLIPFYSWNRKAIPLLIEGAVQKPGKTILAYPRGQFALQNTFNPETSQTPSNPWPADALFPNWIKEKGIGPLGMDLPFSRGGYTLVNPSNPFIDLTAQYSNPAQGIGTSLTPFAKIPAELAFNKELFSGQPITGEQGAEGLGQYLIKQTPIAAPVERIAGIGPEPFNTEAFVNWATAMGLRGTKPYEGQAAFEIREALRRAAHSNAG
jgi:hypothetical protein